MEFEFDDKKSETNEQKHGVNFTDAQELWDDPDAIIIPLRFKDENRFIVTGIFKEKNWSANCTERNGKTRIISFRRAHKKEEEIYENCKC